LRFFADVRTGPESVYLYASEKIREQSTKNAYYSVRRDRGKMLIELLDMESEEFGRILSGRTMPKKT
jgi:hypothetical protein